MHCLDDAIVHFSQVFFWLHSFGSFLFIDENDEPRSPRLRSYNKAEQRAHFLIRFQVWSTTVRNSPHQTCNCKLLQD